MHYYNKINIKPENMKKLWIIGTAVILTLCTSCNRDVREHTGDYSYKLSGLVSFVDASGEATNILATKQGQMNIMEDKKAGRGVVLVTFNEMGGGAYSCTGKISGDSIVFKPFTFSTRFSSADTTIELLQLGKVYTVQAEGRGIIRDGVILMEERWIGQSEDGSNIQMQANAITLLAEEN